MKYTSKFMGCRFLFLSKYNARTQVPWNPEPGFFHRTWVLQNPTNFSGSTRFSITTDSVRPGSGTQVLEPRFRNLGSVRTQEIFRVLGSGSRFHLEPRFRNLGSVRTQEIFRVLCRTQVLEPGFRQNLRNFSGFKTGFQAQDH